jgi:hypothetical protein
MGGMIPPQIFETWDGNMVLLKQDQHFAHYAYYV